MRHNYLFATFSHQTLQKTDWILHQEIHLFLGIVVWISVKIESATGSVGYLKSGIGRASTSTRTRSEIGGRGGATTETTQLGSSNPGGKAGLVGPTWFTSHDISFPTETTSVDHGDNVEVSAVIVVVLCWGCAGGSVVISPRRGWSRYACSRVFMPNISSTGSYLSHSWCG